MSFVRDINPFDETMQEPSLHYDCSVWNSCQIILQSVF
ncbi:hypothetical protein SAMN06265379_11434 [Saccharicrinis carchari]|uniref:Uncharacterized protein n=1 Tax=Saccharicrinis carchari TaxID=1168039 RepID=A0A521F520_SACCC|nr:hypothetical protein SAMN06265379_11434 [Saccharicrinis carchari]